MVGDNHASVALLNRNFSYSLFECPGCFGVFAKKINTIGGSIQVFNTANRTGVDVGSSRHSKVKFVAGLVR
jgi:hypothetical protein